MAVMRSISIQVQLICNVICIVSRLLYYAYTSIKPGNLLGIFNVYTGEYPGLMKNTELILKFITAKRNSRQISAVILRDANN